MTHRANAPMRYLLTAIGLGSALAAAVITASWWWGSGWTQTAGVTGGLLTPLVLVLCARREVMKGATYLHPRADLIGVAVAAAAAVVGVRG